MQDHHVKVGRQYVQHLLESHQIEEEEMSQGDLPFLVSSYGTFVLNQAFAGVINDDVSGFEHEASM